jgi:hypothetical protein
VANATKTWQTEVSELLARAAKLSADNGGEMDPFVTGAADAYLEARPGMREYLEEMQLRETLQKMRERGRIATA